MTRTSTEDSQIRRDLGAERELDRSNPFSATSGKEMLHPPDLNSELNRALRTLKEVVLEGLDHGYFEYSIRCEKANADKRILIIIAGKSHKFSIAPEELKRAELEI